MSAIETVIAGRDLIGFATGKFSLPTSPSEAIGQVLDVTSAGYAAGTVISAIVSVAEFYAEYYPVDGMRFTQRRMMSDFLLL